MSDYLASFGQAELLAVASSLCFTVTLIILRQGMRTGSPLAAVLTINAVVGSGSLVIALFLGTLQTSSLVPLLWFAAMGAVGAGVGSICRMVAAVRMGLGPSTLVASTTPLWGTLLAIAALGERPTARVWAGTLCIVGGVSLITLARERGGIRFREWFRAALIFPVVASIVYAIAPIFTKFAYAHQKTPMVGLGVAFAVGNLLLLAAKPLLPGGGGDPRHAEKHGAVHHRRGVQPHRRHLLHDGPHLRQGLLDPPRQPPHPPLGGAFQPPVSREAGTPDVAPPPRRPPRRLGRDTDHHCGGLGGTNHPAFPVAVFFRRWHMI